MLTNHAQKLPGHRFKPILHAMVRDGRKLPDESGKVPKLNRANGGLIPNCEIVSLIDGNQLAKWSTAYCVPKPFLPTMSS